MSTAAALTTATEALTLEPSSSSEASSSAAAAATANNAATSPITTTTLIKSNAVEPAELNVNASTSSSSTNNTMQTSHLPLNNPAICRYFQRGICRFGSMCRFSHDLTGGDIISTTNTNTNISQANSVQERPSTSRHNWANAPVFVPKADHTGGEILLDTTHDTEHRSWADVVGASGASRLALAGALNINESGTINEICPFEGVCPYGMYCAYAIHLELCEMCDQFCLHPTDETQRKKHKKECLQQHEQAMELSFAIARSKDKTCGICFDTIMEKAGREKRFGILPNCNHIFCLECIRKWRQAKQFEHKITRWVFFCVAVIYENLYFFIILFLDLVLNAVWLQISFVPVPFGLKQKKKRTNF